MPDTPISAVSIQYRVSPAVSNKDLNAVFAAAWPNHTWRDFEPVLRHSLAFICAYAGETLIGFANLAWDGSTHAFLLDPTVHPDWQRRGIGRELVQRATAVAREQGVDWLHVDYESHLDGFYRSCGFQPTLAGLIRLSE